MGRTPPRSGRIVALDAGSMTIEAGFARSRHEELTPSRMILLRSLNLTVLRSQAVGDLFKKIVVRRLISGRETLPVSLRRTIAWSSRRHPHRGSPLRRAGDRAAPRRGRAAAMPARHREPHGKLALFPARRTDATAAMDRAGTLRGIGRDDAFHDAGDRSALRLSPRRRALERAAGHQRSQPSPSRSASSSNGNDSQ